VLKNQFFIIHKTRSVIVSLFYYSHRVEHSTDLSAFHGMFKYLQDNTIYKDKAGLLAEAILTLITDLV